MFRPHMDHHQATFFSYWGDNCTVHFVFCALEHIIALVVTRSFFHRIIPLHLFWRLFQCFYVVYFVYMFLASSFFHKSVSDYAKKGHVVAGFPVNMTVTGVTCCTQI
jgi:hypothetical protein